MTPRLERICEFTRKYLFQPIPKAKPRDAHESADRRKMGVGNEILLQYDDLQGDAEMIVLGLRSRRLQVRLLSGITSLVSRTQKPVVILVYAGHTHSQCKNSAAHKIERLKK